MSEVAMNSMHDFDIVSSQDVNHEPQQQQQHNQVVFENVADQYVKGKDVTAHFRILHDNLAHSKDDQIILLRVGSTNIQECLTSSPVQFSTSTTSGLARHGTATFLASSLPVTDDEFYQFCYIVDKKKCIGTSIPFQLNCSIDDIDLLSSALIETSLEKKTTPSSMDGLITLADNDNEDLVVVHTKRKLIEEKLYQENRQLLELNRRLEQQKDECKAKLELLELKSNEYITKIKNDMLALASTHKTAIDELQTYQRLEVKLRKEYDSCSALCNRYQTESLQFAERCRKLEDFNAQLSDEINQLRLQLTTTTKLTEEQASRIVDIEKRLLDSDEIFKASNKYQSQLEQQLRDLRLTAEKYQMSTQAQICAYSKQASQYENQIHALETANGLLKEELNAVKAENEVLSNTNKRDKELTAALQEQIKVLNEKHRSDNQQKQSELERLQKELEQCKEYGNDYMVLKNSFNEIEKRCVKHQKSEIEVKKQFGVYKEFVADLQRKVEDLTQRLLTGADEYKTLYRKYLALERTLNQTQSQNSSLPQVMSINLPQKSNVNEEPLVDLLLDSQEPQSSNQQQQQQQQFREPEQVRQQEQITTKTPNSSNDNEEIRECPMCYWEFPRHLTLDSKKQHIDNHFI